MLEGLGDIPDCVADVLGDSILADEWLMSGEADLNQEKKQNCYIRETL